jgi:phytoene desaturase
MKDGTIPDEIPFYCSIPSATDPALAPEGDSLMFILIPIPVLSELGTLDWATTITGLKQRVLDRLKMHGAELDHRRIVVEEIFTPVDWKNKFGLYDGSAFGAAHTLFQMGPKRPKNYDPMINGLFFVGASTTPGTGMPMVVISGKMTAERVAEYVH